MIYSIGIVGAAGAFVGGMVSVVPRGVIGGKIAGFFGGKLLGEVAGIIIEKHAATIAGELTKVIIDNVFGDKPFSWKGLGEDLLTGILIDYYPTKTDRGKRQKAADFFLSKLLGKLIKNKSWDDKLQVCLSNTSFENDIYAIQIFVYINATKK